MVEVLVEFSVAAEHDAEVTFRAEVANFIRNSLHDDIASDFTDPLDLPRIDD